MQIVIDIPNSTFTDLKKKQNRTEVDVAVLNGTPLPKTEWIPVNEEPPKEEGSYMTTLDYGEYGLVAQQRYYHGEGIGWSDECVIAWMPLPEPYKPQESEDKK